MYGTQANIPSDPMSDQRNGFGWQQMGMAPQVDKHAQLLSSAGGRRMAMNNAGPTVTQVAGPKGPQMVAGPQSGVGPNGPAPTQGWGGTVPQGWGGVGGGQAPRGGNFNVMNASANWLQNAAGNTRQAMNYDPKMVNNANPNLGRVQKGLFGAANFNPQNVGSTGAGLGGVNRTLDQGRNFQAGQIADTNLNRYQNKYDRQVIDNTVSDLNRARQMTQNDIGAQATAAGAFGGSRHGLVEAENNRNFAEAVADTSAGLRRDSFMNAQNMAQQDINNRIQGQTLNNNAAVSQGNIGISDANRRDGNNRFNVTSDLTANQQGIGALSTIGSQNLQGAQMLNNTRQFNAGQRNNANQNKMNGAQQLAGLSNTAFDRGQTINNNLMQSGGLQQGLQQQIINAAQGQWGGFTGAPNQALGTVTGAIGASPGANAGTQTQSYTPGLMDLLPFAFLL